MARLMLKRNSCPGSPVGSLVGLALALSLAPHSAHAWAIGDPLNTTGCHEPMTAEALRNVRKLLSTAPALTPTRDEKALISLVPFSPPADFIPDLAAMTLLLGVRDNDLKGQNVLDSLDLTEVHGNPANQDEHCVRSANDDGTEGDIAALVACRTFIREKAVAALDGLGANGVVDPSIRVPLKVYVTISGQINPPLPLFYVRMGQAMHALEDGFSHTYRTSDGGKVTAVLNWIELVGGTLDEVRDGPPHSSALDQCGSTDPIVVRNLRLAQQAATELLTAALDPSLTRDQKAEEFDAITEKYLTYQQGCTYDNKWCDAPEADVTGGRGCAIAPPGGRRAGLAGLLTHAGLVLGVFGLRWLRRRHALALLLAAALFAPARADTPPPTPAPLPPAGSPNAPVVPTPPKAEDVGKAQEGKEPGRDVKTPTVSEVEQVREDKRLGPALGFAFSVGGSIARGAAVTRISLRYRLDERWITGLNGEWNPWITSSPLKMRAGALNVSASLIRRFPMAFDRVNLRTSVHLGTSTLLFDVYGAPKYKTGAFFAVSILGLDIDLGGSLRLVFDPAEIAVPIPVFSPLPLYYEQWRFMLGIQYGA